MIIRSVVVLPAPFGPSSPNTLPRGTSRERSFTATWPAKAFRIPLRTMALSFMDPPTPAILYSPPWPPSPRRDARARARRAQHDRLRRPADPRQGGLRRGRPAAAPARLALRHRGAAHRAPGARPPAAAAASGVRLWAIGSVFVFNSIAYFRALEQIPASVTALVLYTYPVIVALLAALVGVERLTWRALLATLGAFAGCALTAGGAPAGAPLRLSGVAWALAAALVYASYIVLSSRFGCRRARAGSGAPPRAGGRGALRGLRPRGRRPRPAARPARPRWPSPASASSRRWWP